MRLARFSIVRVAFHVVRRSDGTGGLSVARLANALDLGNGHFDGAPMAFMPVLPIQYIDSDAFYMNIDTSAEIDALRLTNSEPRAVNIYFTEHLENENGPLCGISSFASGPWSDVQGIVMKNECTATVYDQATFSHEIGHYFNLYHTHEVKFGEECVDGSNCAQAGDLLCDTPADPGLNSGNVQDCAYTGNEHDPCHSDPYNPQVANLMSYSPAICKFHFTTGQDARADTTLLDLRTDHIEGTAPCGEVTYVDWRNASGDGTWQDPYRTIGEGYPPSCVGGFVGIAAGYYAEAPITLNSPAKLNATGGTVTVGN